MSAKSRAGIFAGIAIIVIIALVIGSWYIRSRNEIVTLDEEIESAWAEIDNQLQRRSDLIGNLVESVKGAMAQERDIFTAIADARARMSGATTVEETAEGYNEVQGALSRLLVVMENYPDIRSGAQMTQLMDELAGTENRIAVARKRYNDQVQRYNTRIRTFPGSMIASSMGFEKRDYFEIEESARTAPRVNFN
jgi:LemA protein